jgi:hypothetical protein
LVLIGGVAALLGMNGLEHAAHLANPDRRDLAEDVAIEMHHAALVGKRSSEALAIVCAQTWEHR